MALLFLRAPRGKELEYAGQKVAIRVQAIAGVEIEFIAFF